MDKGQLHIGGKRQVGPLLTRLREGSGKTSREVAYESGVPQSSLAQWETGHHCPNVSSLSKILKYYGVTATIGVAL